MDLQIEGWISLALGHLEVAYNALHAEMETVKSALEEDVQKQQGIKNTINILIDFINFLKEKKLLLAKLEKFFKKLSNSLEEEELRSIIHTVKYLQQDFKNEFGKFSKSRTGNELKTLILQASVLSNFTKLWSLYREVWGQRLPIMIRPLIDESLEIVRPAKEDSIDESYMKIADEVVRALYDNKNKHLDLKNEQMPIVVPFMTRLYATGLNTPMPVIVAHYLGHKQVWTWLSYAHEVGHYLYRNIRGLSDELKIEVVLRLLADKYPEGITIDYDMFGIWFNWLEEIFADTVGLLILGKEFDRTQMRMLLHMPPEIIHRVNVGADPREGLLQAIDLTHPIPYLRARIAFKVLTLLDPLSPDSDAEQWERFVTNKEDVDTSEVSALVRRRDSSLDFIPKKVSDMDYVRDIVLSVILKEKLYALAPVIYEITDESLKCLQQAGIDKNILNILTGLKNKKFIAKNELWDAVEKQPEGPHSAIEEYKELILRHVLHQGDKRSLEEVFKEEQDLRESQIERAQKAIEDPETYQDNGFEIRHILAAAQRELERLGTADKLEGLSDKVLRVMTQKIQETRKFSR